jgi:hypothetical protein
VRKGRVGRDTDDFGSDTFKIVSNGR